MSPPRVAACVAVSADGRRIDLREGQWPTRHSQSRIKRAEATNAIFLEGEAIFLRPLSRES